MPEYFVIGADGEERRYEIETRADGRYAVRTPEGRELEVDAYAPGEGLLNVVSEGAVRDLVVHEGAGEEWVVDVAAERHVVEVLNARARRMRAAGVGSSRAGGPELKSPMAGKVVAWLVAVGDQVEQGQPILVVEAMKMENELKAHVSGEVTELPVPTGENVEVGDVLARIESDEA